MFILSFFSIPWNDNRFSREVNDPLECEEQRLLGKVLYLNDHIPFEFYFEFLWPFFFVLLNWPMILKSSLGRGWPASVSAMFCLLSAPLNKRADLL